MRWLGTAGKFVGTAELPPGSQGKHVLLIGRVASEPASESSSDQRGDPYIYAYAEPRSYETAKGQHYNARTLRAYAKPANQWSAVWGVFQVGEQISKVNFEIRQANGRGSAARFDDLGVYLFDTADGAQSFVSRYQGVKRQLAAAPSAPPASIAPRGSVQAADDEGSAIVRCEVRGRVVFTRKSECDVGAFR